MLVGGGGVGTRGIKRRKKWDNSNSTINKIYLKIKKKLKMKVLYDPVFPLLGIYLLKPKH